METPMYIMCDVKACYQAAVWVKQGKKMTLWLCDACCKINPRAWNKLHRQRDRQGWKLVHRQWFPPPRITYPYPEACPEINRTPEPPHWLGVLAQDDTQEVLWPPPTIPV